MLPENRSHGTGSLPTITGMNAKRFTEREDEFWRALQRRDASYEGIFFVGVKTTGIFRRPICSARKPLRKNIAFFPGKSEALHAGFRPCLRCKPMNTTGEVPTLVEKLRRLVEQRPTERLRERDLVDMGIEPSTARRQFRRYFGMSFHAYQRARRMGSALAAVRAGGNVLDTQLDHGFESSSGFREAFAKLFGTAPSAANGVHCLFARWIELPLGAILALADDSGLYVFDWVDRRGLEREIIRLREKTKFAIVPGDHPVLDQAEREIGEYFAGLRKAFTLPFAPRGTEFQRRVWDALVQYSGGRNALLRGHCQADRRTESGAGRGARQWRQFSRHRHPVPSGDRQRWIAHGLRRRLGAQAVAAGPRTIVILQSVHAAMDQ